MFWHDPSSTKSDIFPHLHRNSVVFLVFRSVKSDPGFVLSKVLTHHSRTILRHVKLKFTGRERNL